MVPFVFADSVSSIASAVELPPVPAMIGMRPRACCTAMRISSLCSSKLTVGDSPVVPTTTMPSVPSAACQSMRFLKRARSSEPSSRMGVMMAARLPGRRPRRRRAPDRASPARPSAAPSPKAAAGRRAYSALRLQLGRLGAQALFLLAQFRRELGAEVLGLEHLANLDLGLAARHRVGAALDPLDRLFLRLHLPEPEAGDQFLRLGERADGDNAPIDRDAHPHALP